MTRRQMSKQQRLSSMRLGQQQRLKVQIVQLSQRHSLRQAEHR